eukprot:6180822-Pleurochrysis_carterae.AAC.4
MMGGLDGERILRLSLDAAPNVGYYLPKNSDKEQVVALAAEAGVGISMEMRRKERQMGARRKEEAKERAAVKVEKEAVHGGGLGGSGLEGSAFGGGGLKGSGGGARGGGGGRGGDEYGREDVKDMIEASTELTRREGREVASPGMANRRGEDWTR